MPDRYSRCSDIVRHKHYVRSIRVQKYAHCASNIAFDIITHSVCRLLTKKSCGIFDGLQFRACPAKHFDDETSEKSHPTCLYQRWYKHKMRSCMARQCNALAAIAEQRHQAAWIDVTQITLHGLQYSTHPGACAQVSINYFQQTC